MVTGSRLLQDGLHEHLGEGCSSVKVSFGKQRSWRVDRGVKYQVEPSGRFLKTFPTVNPITVPIIAPATKSENQWIVIETPRPM